MKLLRLVGCAQTVTLVLVLLLGSACSNPGSGSGGDAGDRPVVQLTANPTSIALGGTSTLSWSSTDADSCVASGGVGFAGSVATSGAQPVQPTATTTYHLACTGPGGTGSAMATVIVQIMPPPSGPLAFPTAEGFGRFAKGGRGGAVYEVTTLADSGAGSLRACVEASGPRTCVFRVAGEIAVDGPIRARDPYLTIAGQTAPGDGVMLTNRNGPNLDYPLYIASHDIIVRHIRSRPGPSPQPSSNVKAMLIGSSDTHDVIVDHASLSWATDEDLTIVGNGGVTNYSGAANTRNVTVQWSMIYETLRNSTHTSANHSRSTYFGYGSQDITFHHNIIANNTRRNPNLGTTGQVDFINNIIYNSGQYNGEIYNRHGTNNLNWVGNVVIAGPSSPKRTSHWSLDLFVNMGLGTHRLYVADNLDLNRPTDSGDDRRVVDPKDWQFIHTTPVGTGVLSLDPSSITAPQQGYKDVLAFSGTTRPARDAADARLVSEIRTCTGSIIDDPSEVGGWPTLRSGTPPADGDHDGMPDAWETSRGLNPANPDDRNGDDDDDGYTNLEEYLDEMAGDLASPIGTGTGADADPTCGAAVANGSPPEILLFDISPRAVVPGGTVTITWQADANSCKRTSFDTNPDPFVFDSSLDYVLGETKGLDLICTRESRDDWINIYAFATANAMMPRPDVTFAADSLTVPRGQPVTFQWHASDAGECVASGAWFGIKTVIGQETFLAETSGSYVLTCEGPGGQTSEIVDLVVVP